ncbi:MAG: site-specific DNA-methyltransferase [Mesorhizobium sp.]|nr:MAG: site-specific DNA-methyltransferase [Mesorhizobium sp.]
MSQKFEKLKTLLKELFQLDQPDLDFGLYRIMHAKSAEVTQFLDQELLPQVTQAFSLYKTSDKAELEKELAKAIDQAQSLGADPEALPKVKDLRAKLANDAVDIGGLENEVYDHLFSFFRRYYSEGDFLAKRVYRPGVYAIPYEGEEVKLHWANRDQYYIKTSEYLRDYAFQLRPGDAAKPMRVHFRLVDAAEGEHGNNKATEGKDRVFILATGAFIAEEDGDLVLRFAYRPANLSDWPESERDGKKKPPAQKDLTAFAVTRILAVSDAAFTSWIADLAKPHVTISGETPGHSRLEGHLMRYTARNTFDYFIHRDLGVFLRRELDFYVKNEVMHLDDIESDTAPRVEQYLSKIKIVRRIAGKIIDFLAQLEEFQKKLWLKKKFVVETRYSITLDRIPDEFYPEITANDAQREEWVKLLAIDQIKGDLTSPAYSVPLTTAFLKAFPTLMIDTSLFTESFKDRLLASIDDLESGIGGVVVDGENFQALTLMQEKYRDQIDCVYVDPPYNTDASAIIYKNDYKHSSWLSLIDNRVSASSRLMTKQGVFCMAIDDEELSEARQLLGAHFQKTVGIVAVRSNPQSRKAKGTFSPSHEYALFYGKSHESVPGSLELTAKRLARYPREDEKGRYSWMSFIRTGTNDKREDRPKMHFPIYVDREDKLRIPRMTWSEDRNAYTIEEEPKDGEVAVYPIVKAPEGVIEKRWHRGYERVIDEPEEFRVRRDEAGVPSIDFKTRIDEDSTPVTWWDKNEYASSNYGAAELKALFGIKPFDFPKALGLVVDCIRASNPTDTSKILDYFSGSGTTGHAVINLNREDGGRRQFILVEMGKHVDTVVLPRLKKVTFTPNWTDGKPTTFASSDEAKASPGIIKVIRLESYEDALNNLVSRRTAKQDDLLASTEAQGADQFKEQYMLRYMLDVETRGSQSLLNIGGFSDPTAYRLNVKRPGSDESREVNVDLLESFNWLVGLRVQGIAVPQGFAAEFERDAEGRMVLKGRLRQDANGPWRFRTVTGTTPDGRRTLIIWRKLTGNIEEDNLVLDTWFMRAGYSAKDSEFGLIYVNGDNNLENLKAADDTWKVRLIEEDFHRLMFDTEGL